MSRWIFVIKGSDEEFQNRIKAKEWPIFDMTPNRRNLRIGDLMLFYKAGKEGQRFIGNAAIKTKVKEQSGTRYFVEMDRISVWKKQVEIKDIITKLDFIENKKFWGRYFQGGIRPISDKDYNLIVTFTESILK